MAEVPGSRHEWVVAGEKDDVERLAELKESSGLAASDGKVRDGFVAAAGHNALKALDFFLAWGTPIDCQDTIQRRPLHHATRNAALSSIQFLCQRGADLERCDSEGSTALKVAIKVKQMASAKALLLEGAKLPEDASAPGLAACVREVQLERQAQKLKRLATSPEVSGEALEAAEGGVWRCQLEHQRLLGLREEQKAGQLLARYDQRLAEERAVAERGKLLESENASELNDKRVDLVSRQNHLKSLLRDMQTLSSSHSAAKAEDSKLRADLEARRELLTTVRSELEAREAVLGGEQEELDNAEARWSSLEHEIAEQRLFNADELAELEAARRELEGWRADREAAFRLTAQAHKLLGN